MSLIDRVHKVVADTGAVTRQDSEAMAKAAVATVFNWLHDPTTASFAKAARKSRVSPATCEKVWVAMLDEIRREAGI
ncbi:hypothetical protein [Novosphingobium aquimarinum]|uniref:hypothetical protein n=1 Tax=Novosphingobium aquimarinum TaxID=2682494 RepID=UPI0012EB38B9|nr:hypothetical protein [Novosphingobium aquimarinum]